VPDAASIRIGVSACLLGQPVRWNGAHKRDPCVLEMFGGRVEWVAVCPELEMGLGVPRPPLRLVRARGSVRLVETDSGRDHTRAMRRFAAGRVRALRALELCGYVLKKDSPSCGLLRVPVYDTGGSPQPLGEGLFARALREAFPELPIEEEGRLHDPALRESFTLRVLAYARLRAR
jgi:uncharacterized protein YbbK (DUF523 family)